MRFLDRRTAIRTVGAAAAFGTVRAVASTAMTGLTPGSAFPDVVYRTEDGRSKSVAASRGEVTMLYLWAVWCPICYNDIVNIQVIFNNLKTDPGFSPIVLNVMDDYKKGVSWARGRGITLPLSDAGMDGRSSTATTTSGTFQFPRYTPQFYVLDRSGAVAYAVAAAAAGTQANLEAIRKLLNSAV